MGSRNTAVVGDYQVWDKSGERADVKPGAS